jgi:hypothetical protein
MMPDRQEQYMRQKILEAQERARQSGNEKDELAMNLILTLFE